MARYIGYRIFYALVLLVLVSMVSFLVIELPPGDYLSTVIAKLEQTGTALSDEQIAAMTQQYGLDLPIHMKYLKWISGFFVGNFGYSFEWGRPVASLIAEPMVLTLFIAIIIVFFTYLISIPIGIYSATHQYSIGDNVVTVFGFLGLATPNFLVAVVILFFGLRWFNVDLSGLFSSEYLAAPWSFGRFIDMMMHLPVQVLVVSTALSASLIRVMRASLLDELQKQYVVTARAKGVDETALLFKYPVRLALNPIISEFAMILPATISAATITAVVLGFPTAGPMLLRSLISQDIYLSASILMMMTFLVVIGSSLADFLLVTVDPRIRLDKSADRG
ncbi:ABC transporter permease [Devosia rhodophyticola]|uniref:ABC transporter permease n=1 Tax=Devosia rhodophyticola TaxID=3026423 RepID=A0ABY7YV34_9HYPH|nr:ABC transporter permease [Devosia rhodophyticola]WDR04794.1 ABC transporter permease [Devosia rhodophyticola]